LANVAGRNVMPPRGKEYLMSHGMSRPVVFVIDDNGAVVRTLRASSASRR